jgi:hypothetical protein
MLLGAFNRRLASRGSRRELKGSRRESAALRLDRERLSQQLDDERAGHLNGHSLNDTSTPVAVKNESTPTGVDTTAQR